MVRAAIILLSSFSVVEAIAPAPRLLLMGLGNVGRAVQHDTSCRGFFDDRIQGTSRSPDDDNNKAVLFTPGSISALMPKCTHVLITIPPPREEDPVFDAVMKEVESRLPRGAWLGFVSTTGVYGHHDGAWVTEESPLYCSESSPTHRYIEHENKWRELSQRCRWTCRIFRCAGLYGPDRSALHTLWKKRTLTISPAADITNRIHETDVARAIVASMVAASEPRTDGFRAYNLSDDEPETRTVVMKYAADLLKSRGIDITVEETADSSPSSTQSMARATRRRSEIKRVSNQRMKQELVSKLDYPTYREGLTDIFKDPSSPWQKTKQ